MNFFILKWVISKWTHIIEDVKDAKQNIVNIVFIFTQTSDIWLAFELKVAVHEAIQTCFQKHHKIKPYNQIKQA